MVRRTPPYLLLLLLAVLLHHPSCMRLEAATQIAKSGWRKWTSQTERPPRSLQSAFQQAGEQDSGDGQSYRPDMDPGWQAARLHHLGQLKVHGKPVVELAPDVLTKHKFILPEAQLRRGMAYSGSGSRLRAAMAKAMRGEPVKVGVVGGSITTGHGASRKGETDWVSLVKAWLGQAFKDAQLKNGAVAGTPSSYMVVCLEMSVDPDVDIVFAEYVLNDGYNDNILDNPQVKGIERLVRRMLALAGQPALVLMQTWTHGLTFPRDSNEWKPFHHTTEEVYGQLARYYDLHWLSVRDSVYRLAVFNEVPEFSWAEVTNSKNLDDWIHPSDLGHRVMADLAIWLFQETALDVLTRPIDDDDGAVLSEPLPEPMYAGNSVPGSPMCWHFEAMSGLVKSADGFEFIEEGAKKKKGYVGTAPGSSLTLVIDTVRSNPKGSVIVQFGHLRSYEHMGQALAKCISGCECKEKVINGHHQLKQSQTFLATLLTSQHPECTIQLTITSNTDSGEYKFKLSGVMVSDMAVQMASHQQQPQFLSEGEWLAMDHAQG